MRLNKITQGKDERQNNSKPEAELGETPIFYGWAKKVEDTEAFNRNVRNLEASDLTQFA